VVACEARIASDAMKVERWACNRRETLSLITAARKLATRLPHFPSLRFVLFLTDSKVAEAHAGEFKEPNSASVEAFPIIRPGVEFNDIIRDLGNHGVVVEVSHIEGKKNSRADSLSREAEMGGFKDVVFMNKVGKAGTAEVLRIDVMAEKMYLP
jgi:hypothetical protein